MLRAKANRILDEAGYKKGGDGVRVTPAGVKMKVLFQTSQNSLRQKQQALIKEGVQTFVEVGPGNVLSGLIKRIDRSVKTVSVSTPEEVDKLEETLLSA